MEHVTQALDAVARGEPEAAGRLLPLVYDELRRLATQKLAQEEPGQTLQASALVHEAYLRLVGAEQAKSWNGRGHFFTAAAEAMRRILIENARRRHSLKRGGGHVRCDLDGLQLAAPEPVEDPLALDDALNRLTALDPVKAELVKLRYFAGLTIEEAADALGISSATTKRYWTYARTWLYQAVADGPANPAAAR